MTPNPKSLLLAALVAAVCFPNPTLGSDDARIKQLERQQDDLRRQVEKLAKENDGEQDSKIDEIDRRQGILTEELRRIREAVVLPETKELKSAYGLGPAASKVYGVERGLSIGGYGEANFNNIVSDRGSGGHDVFDLLRVVLYTGYKFNDWIVFNAETEFEHASTGKGGEVSVEFATLDFLLHPAANVRAGLVLVPMGFVNEQHESVFFHGNVRPPVEQRILPSTWRSNGFGLFGEVLPGLEYRTYGITSMNAANFSASGIRGGRQSGSFELADDWSWVGRVDYTLLPGTLVGGSALIGDQGQNQEFDGARRDALMQIYELHGQFRSYGVELRALGALTRLDDSEHLSAQKNDTIADTMFGWYAEAAYDVMPLLAPDAGQYLAPWLRYSRSDTQRSVPRGLIAKDSQDQQAIEMGITYKPVSQVALKLDYRIQTAQDAGLPNEIRIGGGYVF